LLLEMLPLIRQPAGGVATAQPLGQTLEAPGARVGISGTGVADFHGGTSVATAVVCRAVAVALAVALAAAGIMVIVGAGVAIVAFVAVASDALVAVAGTRVGVGAGLVAAGETLVAAGDGGATVATLPIGSGVWGTATLQAARTTREIKAISINGDALLERWFAMPNCIVSPPLPLPVLYPSLTIKHDQPRPGKAQVGRASGQVIHGDLKATGARRR
jgi:hypothetical protein